VSGTVSPMQSLKAALLAEVSASAWRGEVALCRQFEPSPESVPNALFELVSEGRLEWFGDNEKALRYRLPSRRATYVRGLRRTRKGLKWCSGCDEDWPVECFSRDRSRPDGRRNQCTACRSKRRRELGRW